MVSRNAWPEQTTAPAVAASVCLQSAVIWEGAIGGGHSTASLRASKLTAAWHFCRCRVVHGAAASPGFSPADRWGTLGCTNRSTHCATSVVCKVSRSNITTAGHERAARGSAPLWVPRLQCAMHMWVLVTRMHPLQSIALCPEDICASSPALTTLRSSSFASGILHPVYEFGTQ